MIEEAPKFADALVAATLVTATLTILTAIWQPRVDVALAVDPGDDSGRRAAAARQTCFVFVFRALPLAAAATATCCLLMIRTFSILWTVRCWRACSFDDVSALYVVNAALLAFLSVGSWFTAWQLYSLRRKLLS